MNPIVTSILALIQYAPAAINEIMALYNAVKGDLSENDQAAIDQALADSQTADASATATADTALDEAAQR